MPSYHICSQAYCSAHLVPGAMLFIFSCLYLANGVLTIVGFTHRVQHIYTAFFAYFGLSTLVTLIQIEVMPPPFAPKYDPQDIEEPYKSAQRLYVCEKCGRLRTLRTHHCKICGQCVDRFDHHCGWSFRCVGQSNYPYFFKYALFCLCSHVSSLCGAIWGFSCGFYAAGLLIFIVLISLNAMIVAFEVSVMMNQFEGLRYNLTLCEKKEIVAFCKNDRREIKGYMRDNIYNNGMMSNSAELLGGSFWSQVLFFLVPGCVTRLDKKLVYPIDKPEETEIPQREPLLMRQIRSQEAPQVASSKSPGESYTDAKVVSYATDSKPEDQALEDEEQKYEQ